MATKLSIKNKTNCSNSALLEMLNSKQKKRSESNHGSKAIGNKNSSSSNQRFVSPDLA